MGKTRETLDMEMRIWRATSKQGVFGCFEVTIGWFGNERVDYMTFDTKRDWRCYEIKTSKEDFHSDAKLTFIGNLNYFVMPRSLYEHVRAEIPREIGVYVDSGNYAVSVKKATRRSLKVDETTLINSFIRSLSRDADKFIQERNELHGQHLEQLCREREREAKEAMQSWRREHNERSELQEFMRQKGYWGEWLLYRNQKEAAE
jgi:hypothetical protein